MILTKYMYFLAFALSITLIFIIYMMATKRKYTKKLLGSWLIVSFAILLFSLFTSFISNPPESVAQFKAVVSSFREFISTMR